MPLTAPAKDEAPICAATPPTWIETMMPNGIATRIVGRTETRLMNHAWRRNSDQEHRPRTLSAIPDALDSQASTIIPPAVPMPVPLRPPRSLITPPGRHSHPPPPHLLLLPPLLPAPLPPPPPTPLHHPPPHPAPP